MKFLMNQSVSSNPPFFLRLLSPFVCSCGPIKGSRIGFAKFFRRNTTPLRVWRFPRNPLGLETLPFQFAFYLCHRNNQTSGERGQRRCVRETDSHIQATPVPPFRQGERISGQIRMFAGGEPMLEIIRWSDFVKETRTERMRQRNRLSPPAILNAPSGFQFASDDSRFLSSADSRACLVALSVILHRQDYMTCPMT